MSITTYMLLMVLKYLICALSPHVLIKSNKTRALSFRWEIFKPITVIYGWDTCCEIALRRI